MATQEISAFSNFSGTNEQGYVIVGGSNGVEGGKKILSDIVPVVPEQVQADWEQDDDTQKDYIKNKPDIPQIDEETIIINDENKLAVAKPIPDSIGYAHNVLTVETNDGDLSWHEPTVYKAGKGLNYSSGGSEITFNVAVPIPDPKGSPAANDGDVLTYNAQSDEIVWAAPQGGGGLDFSDLMSWENTPNDTVADYIENEGGSGGGNVYFELYKPYASNIWKIYPYVQFDNDYKKYYGNAIGSGSVN